MTKHSDHSGNVPPDARKARKARLARALRDNLKRRKAQARDRNTQARSADSTEAAEQDSGSRKRTETS